MKEYKINKSNYSITFIDEINKRRISYDDPMIIEFLDTDAVRIKCKDGFQTIINKNEWQKIEVESYD